MQEFYLNKPQMRALLIDAPVMILIYGRRLGKSTEIIAHLSIKRIFEMPRALFMILGITYKQLLERTLPATKTGWAKRGYIEGVHYVIGKRPPKIWPQPHYLPSSWDHTISWYNGTCFCLGSQDREGLVNSLTTFGLFADESKFLRENRFKEDALPTISSPQHFFPGNPHNRFLVLCSSMPSLPEGQWLFDYEKLMDPTAAKIILSASIELEKLRADAYNAQGSSLDYLNKQIKIFEKELAVARKGLVYYDEASTFANINILGMDYIYQQRDILKDMFNSEILNLRPKPGEKSFYVGLSLHHFYTAYNYTYLDEFNHRVNAKDLNCRMDEDINSSLPLIIGMDFGAQINCIVSAQRDQGKFRTLKNHFCLRPKILNDVCEQWCEYYASHPTKQLRFWYDKSGNIAQANSKETYAQQAARIFRAHGWEVLMLTKGGANSRHHEKYLLINSSLRGRDPKLPSLFFNEGNCEELKESMQNAPAKKDPQGLVKKVKTSESSPNVPPQYATHMSDAWDYMFYGEYYEVMSRTVYNSPDPGVR